MYKRLVWFASFAVRSITLMGLMLHFGATLLFVFPANPIKLQVGHVADLTIGVYFPQNWSLFAPNPVDSTQSLLLKCLTEDELALSSGAAVEIGPADWRDVSSAHFSRAHASPLSAYERLVRPLQNSLRRYVAGGQELVPFFQACKKGDTLACTQAEKALPQQREHAAAMIRKVASAFCRESYPERALAAVAVRYRERQALPWSKRGTAPAEPQDYQIGIFKIDGELALPGLYRGGNT